jgi:hypothetical protein
MSKIVKHIYISNSRLFVDGALVLRGESSIFVKFLKEVYKFVEIKYPKYFKMDALSKLGFVASEVLLHDQEKPKKAERVGIAVGNRASTYLVDTKHQQSIEDKENYFPSPSNFVYTLPNVMTGEICIRNGFKGENAVFVSEKFDIPFLVDYLNVILQADKADRMVAGYINADVDDYEAFLFIVDRTAEQLNAKEIQGLYESYHS